MDQLEPYSAPWWLDRLITALAGKQAHYELLDRYHRSDPPLPPGPAKGRNPAFDYLRKKARVNWADLIVESVVERMTVVGFSSGPDNGSQKADADAWKIWQGNDLDTGSVMLHRTKATLGDAYVIVGDIDETIGVPRVTCEDPRDTIGAADPIDRRTLVAALKVFIDDVAGVDRAYVYLAGEVHRATRPRGRNRKVLSYDSKGWIWEEPEYLGHDRVPVVWFPNRADLKGRVMGEFEHVIDDLDRINLLVLQRVQIAVLQAFRQRAIKGELPEKDAAGNAIDYNVLFSSDPAALWQLPPGVDMWESAGVDLTPILESVKADVRELAGRTRTPLYYLYPNEGGSAEGAVTQREALIFRSGARITETSGPWEMVQSIALEVMGKTPPSDMETLWLPPSLATEAERYDAATKALGAGMTWREVMSEVLQLSPQTIDRMAAEHAAAGTPVPGTAQAGA